MFKSNFPTELKPYEADFYGISKRLDHSCRISLVKLASRASLSKNIDGSKRAAMRLSILNRAKQPVKSILGYAYIPQGDHKYENFITSLRDGTELMVIYDQNGIYTDIRRIYLHNNERSRSHAEFN
jgi:hypothetical protein